MDQEEDDDFVEEPMAADYDFTNSNEPIAIDDTIYHGFLKFENVKTFNFRQCSETNC